MEAERVPAAHRQVGLVIRLLRQKRGLRQTELAALAGLKQSNLSRIESGLTLPRGATEARLATALGCAVEELLSEDLAREADLRLRAALTPRNAGQLLSGRLSAVPLLSPVAPQGLELDRKGRPAGRIELLLQLPPLPGRPFALRGGEAGVKKGRPGFRPSDLLVFSDQPAVRSGDWAYARTLTSGLLARVRFPASEEKIGMTTAEGVVSRPLARAEVLGMWKLVLRLQAF